MFLIIAGVIFVLMGFGVHVAGLNLLWFALAFICFHYAWTISIPLIRRPPQ